MSGGASGSPRSVLMLCYFYPPLRTSGTTRSLEFSKRLPEFGWHPRVLTVDQARDPWVSHDAPVPEGIEIHRAPEWNLDGWVEILNGITSRIARVFGHDLARNHWRENVCIPDARIAWRTRRLGRALAERSDCLYASCSPFSSALAALKLKHATGRPLVVDMRDAWTLNPHERHSPLHAALIERFERRVVDGVDRLIVNTEGAAELYRARYPELSDRLLSIPNGYDRLALAPPRNGSDDTFRIMHVGSFYGARSPRRLLEALVRLDDPSIEFVQIGGTFDGAREFEGRVQMRILEAMPRDEALRMMESASILYLKQGFEPGVRDYVAVGAKTYEYLATGLPILADCPPGDNARIVSDYCAAPYVVTSDSADDLAATIRRAREETARFVPSILDAFAERFDRRHLTERLAACFDAVV